MDKKKLLGTIIGVVLFVALIIGITYAWIFWTSKNTIISGTTECFNIIYNKGPNITGSIEPSVDYLGGKNTTVEIGIDPTCNIEGYATIKLTTDSSSENAIDLSSGILKYAVYNGDTFISEGIVDSDNINLVTVNLSKSQVTYTVYLWVDGELVDNSYIGKTYNGYIHAEAIAGENNNGDLALKTLTKLGLSVSEGTPDFNSVAKTNEGIYGAEDDFGTSYYFRGAVENNYVKFAGFYWRIIRINGDGTIRIIYDGTSAHPNGEVSEDRQVGTTAYNSEYGDNASVGYMYGALGSNSYDTTHANTNNSTVKTANDNWYKTNIVDTGFSNNVADVIYCNDRGLSSGTGVGLEVTKYQVNGRIDTNKTPSLKCNLNKDKFTTNSGLGNGNLTYPVGLITADEMVFAGGKKMSTNESYYLYNGNYFWTMSPDYFNGAIAGVWSSFDDGGMSSDRVNRARGLRPVISLKSDLTFTGNGTINQPFEIAS